MDVLSTLILHVIFFQYQMKLFYVLTLEHRAGKRFFMLFLLSNVRSYGTVYMRWFICDGLFRQLW